MSNSASQLFSTGSPLHLVLLLSSRSRHSSICRLCVPLKCVPLKCVPLKACFRLCVFQVCRAGLCRPCGSKKSSQFHYNKNFVLKQINICLSTGNVYISCRTGIRSYLAFVLYIYRKIFSLLLFKTFWKFFD